MGGKWWRRRVQLKHTKVTCADTRKKRFFSDECFPCTAMMIIYISWWLYIWSHYTTWHLNLTMMSHDSNFLQPLCKNFSTMEIISSCGYVFTLSCSPDYLHFTIVWYNNPNIKDVLLVFIQKDVLFSEASLAFKYWTESKYFKIGSLGLRVLSINKIHCWTIAKIRHMMKFNSPFIIGIFVRFPQ